MELSRKEINQLAKIAGMFPEKVQVESILLLSSIILSLLKEIDPNKDIFIIDGL